MRWFTKHVVFLVTIGLTVDSHMLESLIQIHVHTNSAKAWFAYIRAFQNALIKRLLSHHHICHPVQMIKKIESRAQVFSKAHKLKPGYLQIWKVDPVDTRHVVITFLEVKMPCNLVSPALASSFFVTK